MMHDPPFLTACHAVYTHACMVIELIEIRSLDLLQLDTHIPDHRCIMHATVPCHQCNMGRLYNASTHHACFIQYIFTLLFMVLQKGCVCATNKGRCMHVHLFQFIYACMHGLQYVQLAFCSKPQTRGGTRRRRAMLAIPRLDRSIYISEDTSAVMQASYYITS